MLSTRAAASGRRHASKSRKSDDWSEVTDPEERRRIQNRIAQRKFREKAREQKERAERELRNQEHAGSSYQVPGPQDLDVGDELSGLPWGGPSLRHVVARGHESLSSQGSRRASDYMADDVAAAAYSAAGSRSSATAAAGSATSWTDSASAMGDSATASFYDYDNDYDDGSQLYSFPSGSSVEDSQPGSSRTSSDYAHLTDDKNSQYFGNSPYFYE